jgi:hypothetical protein
MPTARYLRLSLEIEFAPTFGADVSVLVFYFDDEHGSDNIAIKAGQVVVGPFPDYFIDNMANEFCGKLSETHR